MSVEREQGLEALRQTHSELVRLTSGLSDAALDFRAAPDDWTIREILAHLVDDEKFVMRTRMERMMKEEQPVLPPHDERKWYASRNTSRDALDQLLGDFAVQRAASLGIVEMLRESDWLRNGYQPENGEFTADEWVGRWAKHDEVHLRQIEARLAEYVATTG